MLMLMFMTMIYLLILLIMIFMMFIFSMKKIKIREKLSPFECGFDLISLYRKPFSIQFYMLSILFLIFDVEITLILPLINYNSSMLIISMLNFIMILLILLLGIFLEWKEGALKWIK